jgi:hypothetical protein
LAETVDAERDYRVAGDRAELGQGRRVEVTHGDQREAGDVCGPLPSISKAVFLLIPIQGRAIEMFVHGLVAVSGPSSPFHLRILTGSS